MRVRIQPYKRGSRSARDIARACGLLRVNLVRTRFRPRPNDLILNWGSSTLMFPGARYINPPYNVGVASDKYASLDVFKRAGVPHPLFTQSRDVAQGWLDNGASVVARTLLRANSGRGIVIVDPGGELPSAPLYTTYVKKYDEYRVHVWDGQVLDIQQKRRRSNYEHEIDSRVRNASGGWVFCRGGVECPEVVADAGVAAVQALGLDFGAADVGFTRRTSEACVYEVNTAPGVEGTTLSHYRGAIERATSPDASRDRRVGHRAELCRGT